MSITYTYEIVAVDEAARCMEVVYKADGHQTMHIGARLPFVGEALEDVIRQFAPVPLWIAAKTPVLVPAVGHSATLAPPVLDAAPPSDFIDLDKLTDSQNNQPQA